MKRTKPYLEIFKSLGGKVDPCDEEIIQGKGWHLHTSRGKNLYFSHKLTGIRNEFLHRKVMKRVLGRELNSLELVDHINGDTKDNRRENLRVCSNAENLRNRKRPPTDNKTGVMGVCFCPATGKWAAEIRLNQKRIWLGRHADFATAVNVRREAEKKYWGEFAPKWGST